mmetsp:Transcript_19257/g.17080  ORF Transcript_19257/g.17080 Transcript_19257/m.17080 type:complete len:175 (+) Transcript_19257:444-968(+)
MTPMRIKDKLRVIDDLRKDSSILTGFASLRSEKNSKKFDKLRALYSTSKERCTRVNRDCAHRNSKTITHSENLEQVLKHSSKEIPEFLIPVKKIQNTEAQAKMKKDERLMRIIETRISEEIKSCTRIPKVSQPEIFLKFDRKYRILKKKCEPRLGRHSLNRTFDISNISRIQNA